MSKLALALRVVVFMSAVACPAQDEKPPAGPPGDERKSTEPPGGSGGARSMLKPTPEPPATPAKRLSELLRTKCLGAEGAGAITVVVEGRRVEVALAGIESAETFTAFAVDAHRSLNDLVKGEYVHLEFPDGKAGMKAEKPAAYVFRGPDGLFVNLELVRQGHAKAAAPAPEYADLFKHYQSAAVESERGMWAPSAAKEVPRPAADKKSAGKADEPRKAEGTPGRVCVTESGRKYHRADCEFVKGRKTTTLSIAEAKQKGYTACSRCDPR